MQTDGLDAHVKDPGVHDIDEPEFSILKQRVARRIVAEGLNVDKLDIAALTKVRPSTPLPSLQHPFSSPRPPSHSLLGVRACHKQH